MIGLLQRVSNASVAIDGETVGSIGVGVLLMVAVERRDSEASAERLLERVLGYRVFPAAQGKMNLSLRDIGGGLLLVPQFTLAADTAKGTRASFSSAAAPQDGERLFAFLVERARASHAPVAAGRFGANMRVSLVNDGPVTFWLRSGEGRD
jgi:D-tyrosyl-tRNA(Tyr) deacylase